MPTIEIKRPGMTDQMQASDKITYEVVFGDIRITNWAIWSEYFEEFVDANLLTIKACWPDSFGDALEKATADSLFNPEAKADRDIDMARDEAI